MKKASVWFEIYVDDIERATKFYENVLDTKLELLGDPSHQGLKMMSFPGDMESYGAGGALVQMEGVQAGGNSTIVYFGSEDSAIEESRVVRAGGRIMRPKMSIGEYGFISLCFDTEGNIFGIHSMK
ncbi:VOC family protein [Candidatus Kaiserbacteria bacterium]|nr:MAG: VOC family protein [Candidatus Kaiserbacteria bacterium]